MEVMTVDFDGSVRQRQLARLMALAGRVEILENDEIEAADFAEAQAWAEEAGREGDPDGPVGDARG